MILSIKVNWNKDMEGLSEISSKINIGLLNQRLSVDLVID